VDRIIPAVADLMEPAAYAATAARLAGAVPRNGAAQIAHILLEQSQLAPPGFRRRLNLPRLDELRHLSTQRLRRLGERRPHLPAIRARHGAPRAGRAPRRLGAGRLPRWLRSRRS
jgi:hypothetical protein